MVRQTSANVDKLPIRDPQKWWDTFLTSVRSKTVEYTKRKHSIENECRNRLRGDLLRLEAVPTDLHTNHLGVYPDSQLNFSKHIRESILKATKGTYLDGYLICLTNFMSDPISIMVM